MTGRRFCRVLAACIGLWLTACGGGTAAHADGARVDSTRAGIVRGAWQFRFSPERGVSLSYQGVPVTLRSSLYVVKPGWTGLLYDQRAGKPTVSVSRDGTEITVRDESRDVRIGYVLTLGADGSAVTDFSYSLTHDIPGAIEYAAGFLNGPLLADAPYQAGIGAGTRTGIVPYAPPSGDPEQHPFLPAFQSLTVGTRLGTLKVSAAGDWPDFVCFDARGSSESWAQEAPIFWMGLGVSPHPVQYAGGRTFHVLTRYEFLPPSPSLTPRRPAGSENRPAAPLAATSYADARVPPVTPPVIIPRPKAMTLRPARLRLNARTQLVIADSAGAQDREAALAVGRVLARRCGLPGLPVVRASAAGRTDNLLVFGEPGRMPLAARLLARAGAAPATKAEGYTLRVGPSWAVVAGHDPAGTFYGAQTLCQLLARDARGPFAWTAAVDDYPSLAWRGAHLFVGNQALPFHTRLIQNVFAPLKLNNLVLQCEQARWQTVGRAAPSWAMSKDDLRRENAFAARHFLAVTPLVESVGHMEWLFSDPARNGLAEDPQTPYAVAAGPAADRFLFRLYDEVLDVFHPRYLHIGADEVTMRGRYPYRSRSVYPTVAAEFSAHVTRVHDYLKQRGVGTMIWGDMLLAGGEAPDATDAPTPAEAAQMRAALPHDIVVTDWHYVSNGDFSSPRLLRQAGFPPVIGATWFSPGNIAAFSRAQVDGHQRGLLQTTWAGFNSNARNLADAPEQFAAFVLAGEYAWSGSRLPPGRLPYNPAHIFTDWYAPQGLDPRTRRGFTLDLSPLLSRTLRDGPDRTGWLGYGAAHDLRAVPTGTRRLGGILYAVPPGAVVLRGRLNPSGAAYAAQAALPLRRRVAALSLLLAATVPALPDTRIGSLRIVFADGTAAVVPLRYGRNIAAWSDPRDVPQASVAWQGRTASGEPILLRTLAWNNPHPEKTIASVTLTADDPAAAPVLFAATGLEN